MAALLTCACRVRSTAASESVLGAGSGVADEAIGSGKEEVDDEEEEEKDE